MRWNAFKLSSHMVLVLKTPQTHIILYFISRAVSHTLQLSTAPGINVKTITFIFFVHSSVYSACTWLQIKKKIQQALWSRFGTKKSLFFLFRWIFWSKMCSDLALLEVFVQQQLHSFSSNMSAGTKKGWKTASFLLCYLHLSLIVYHLLISQWCHSVSARSILIEWHQTSVLGPDQSPGKDHLMLVASCRGLIVEKPNMKTPSPRPCSHRKLNLDQLLVQKYVLSANWVPTSKLHVKYMVADPFRIMLTPVFC